MRYTFANAWKGFVYYRKLNVIIIGIYLLAILFPIIVIMFSVQLDSNISRSKPNNVERTLVIYSDSYHFTREDIYNLLNKQGDIIEYILPMEVAFRNVLIGNEYHNMLGLTTNSNFIKSYNLLLNKDIDISEIEDKRMVIVGKNVLYNQKNNKILIGSSSYKIAAKSLNYNYSSYVINFDEKVEANRIEITFNNNNYSENEKQIKEYMNNNFNESIQYLSKNMVKGTVNYFTDFLQKSVKVISCVIIFSIINIVCVIIMQLEEKKTAIAIKFSVGVRKYRIILEEFIELLLMFIIASGIGLLAMPLIIRVINQNLSFIMLYYDYKVVLMVLLLDIVNAAIFSGLYSLVLNYKKALITVKR